MWKRDESVKPAAPPASTPAAAPSAPAAAAPSASEPRAQLGRDMVNIGKSVVIKGELSGSEDLTIEGHVEGRIDLKDNVLTIGPNGKIKAEVFAKAVVVLGEVTGNVTASEKVDIRDNGSVDGDIASPRVAIAEGAHFRGSVDMQRAGQKAQAQQPQPSRPRRRSRASRSSHNRSSQQQQGQRVGAVTARSDMADATRSLTDLFGMLGPRRVADAAAATDSSVTNVAEASYPTKALHKFLTSLQTTTIRCCSISARSSAATSRSSANSSAAAFASKTSPRTSIATSRTARSISCRSSFRSGSPRRAGTVDGILCWDVLDYLDRPAAQALATALSSLLRPTAACWDSSAPRDAARSGLHEIRGRRRVHSALSHLSGARARGSAAC